MSLKKVKKIKYYNNNNFKYYSNKLSRTLDYLQGKTESIRGVLEIAAKIR